MQFPVPGCRKADIIVEVTLFDLIRLVRFLTTPVSDLFSQYCHLGLMICEDNIRYKKLLNKLLKSYSFIESVMKKMSRLDAESEIKNLFEKLSDRDMMEHLMEKMVRPVVVHRLERNDIKQLKRSLHPPAICFM